MVLVFAPGACTISAGEPTERLLLATSASDPILPAQLSQLSPHVRPDEARRVAATAFITGRELQREWRVVRSPRLQNFLVNIGLRKAGLCYQWATELLVRLDSLKLRTLDLHWAESFAGTIREHNAIVVTAKGQPFERGILLDTWRYSGRLAWIPVTADPHYRWSENDAEVGRRLHKPPLAGLGSYETGKRAPVSPYQKKR